jgi:hypothetical protein
VRPGTQEEASVKTPGTKAAKGGKGKRKRKDDKGPFPTRAEERHWHQEERREDRADARREDADSRRAWAAAGRRQAEAEHYEAEARKAEREGYKKEAEYDLAKARREEAEARRDAARARHDAAKARHHEAKARRVGLTVPGAVAGGWILGGNGWHEGCAAVALANHLLAATGKRVSDDEVLSLHVRAAGHPQARASILGVLEAAAQWGLGGWRPVLMAEAPAGEGVPRDSSPWPGLRWPLILSLDLTVAQRDQSTWDTQAAPYWGPHAGLLASDRVITWGREVPVTAAFLEAQVMGAWQVEWRPAGGEGDSR